MSSFARSYLPLGFAVVFGIGNAYYAFQPMLKGQHEKSELASKDGQQPATVSGNDNTK
ncbi:hypothetical protein F5Y19DRAFT_479227 [Xylariaceae sp. FL1651]|nr:hypothetical protein F5Y19DRAFT_479227 [Xylariaceae sp. FL1651]